MELLAFLKAATPEEQGKVAKEAGTTIGYLFKIAWGHAKSGPVLTLKIEAATKGAVCRHVLRSDIHPEDCALATCGNEPRLIAKV